MDDGGVDEEGGGNSVAEGAKVQPTPPVVTRLLSPLSSHHPILIASPSLGLPHTSCCPLPVVVQVTPNDPSAALHCSSPRPGLHPPSPMSLDASQPLSSTPPTPASVKAVPVPFTFVGCTAPALPGSPPQLPTLLSGKAASSALSVACPPGCVVLCFLRLSFPAQLRRLVIRNGRSAFLAVHSTASSALLDQTWQRARAQGELTAKTATGLLVPFVHLLASHQLCLQEAWGSGEATAAVTKVRPFALPPPTSILFSGASTAAAVGLCVELRGVEDVWQKDQGLTLGLQWLEVFGVPSDEEKADDG